MRLPGGKDGESVRITAFGALLIALVVVGILLAGVGPRDVQAPGFVAATLSGAVLLGASASRRGPRGTKGLVERREEFHRRPHKRSEAPLSEEAEDALWQAERQRRLRDGRSA